MKFLAIGVVVLLLGYWMVQEPASLARFTENAGAWAWDLTTTVFNGVIDFTASLFS